MEKTASGQTVLIRDLSSLTLNVVGEWLGEDVLSQPDIDVNQLLRTNPWYSKYDKIAGRSRDVLRTNFAVTIAELFATGKAHKTIQ